MTAWGPPTVSGVVVFVAYGDCFRLQPCYNPARLENRHACCQGEKTRPSNRNFVCRAVNDELIQRATLFEDRRCGAAGGGFTVRDPLLGEYGADASAPHREQIPPVQRGGCQT